MIHRTLFLIAMSWLTAGAAWADNGAKLARDASDMLIAAADRLHAANTASDRITALSGTVRAYETGLSAMREGLRRIALRERELTAKLQDEDQDIAALLALLQNASRHTETQVLLHPGSARDTLRAGTLAAILVPTLHQRAASLDDDLSELAELAKVQTAGQSLLEDSLSGIREARLTLARAMSGREKLPPKVATDEAAMLALVNSAETLSAFADSLLAGSPAIPVDPGRPWPLPVKGEIAQGFNEPDASGRARPGWIIATNEDALVTAPSDATVRFSGEIPGQGTVTILEPKGGSLMILAGIGKSFVQRDQIVAKNEPIGFMSGNGWSTQEKLNDSQDKSSLHRTEKLYMEIRQGRAPVDPADILTLVQE